MHTTTRLLAFAVLAVVALSGCSATGDDAAADAAPGSAPPATALDECEQAADALPAARSSTRLTYWSDDNSLRGSLDRVLGRLNTATGLGLSVAPEGVLVEFVVDMPPELAGFSSDHIEISLDVWLQLDEALLHEVGHQLGARHLGPREGVMSRCLVSGSALLTDADLAQICAASPCTTFQAEVELQ